LLLASFIYFAGSPADPAGAYLRDFQMVEKLTGPTAGPSLSSSLACPPGKVAIGVGARTPGASTTPPIFQFAPNVGINAMWLPSTAGSSVVAGGIEYDVAPAPWLLAMQAQCATFTFTAPTNATAAPYLKDVQQVSRYIPANSVNVKSLEVGCTGRRAIGGGFDVGIPLGQYAATNVAVVAAHSIGNGYRVAALETDATAVPWSLGVYAICANVTDSTSGPTYVGNAITGLVETSPASSAWRHEVGASCPPGRRVIGGGAEILGGSTGTGPPPPDVVFTQSRPSATFWIATAREEDPTSAVWRLRARAICAPLVPATG
jgi:hypothetical protein